MESLNALFNHATEGILITDSNGIIERANPSTEKMFGYDNNELLGKAVEILIPKPIRDKHEKHRENFNANPHARSMGKDMVLLALRKDGSEFPVEISLSYYEKDEKRNVIAFIIDITERHQNSERIKKLNQDLERKVYERTRVLQEALKELENSKNKLSEALEKERELNDMKSRFVTMASHEFRTPLSTILSSISLIGKYPQSEDEPKRQKHVQRVKSAVTNMTLILNDFLSAEKLNEGKSQVNFFQFSLLDMINEVSAEMTNILKPGQHIIQKYEGKAEVYLDKQMVYNILLNLISNAIKFSPENKEITIEVKNLPELTLLSVSDKGMGIPKDEAAHLFQRFFRAKNAINVQGTGLGLNIVGKYVELMKGKIHFESELNVGTEFIITFPNLKP